VATSPAFATNTFPPAVIDEKRRFGALGCGDAAICPVQNWFEVLKAKVSAVK
jgi:hypothetical protein